jgi:phosphopantothenoylcysteine decarboxylase/phosphopantothenate--cysteine ligase
MWSHPATQRNVATLQADGRVRLVGPVEGEVASGDRGMGRMSEPDAIAAAVLAATRGRDLDGLHLAVTAGPTVEDIDPARYLSNRSSGKMGFAIAQRAAARGARVSLVAGPVALATPPAVERIDVRSAADMQAALDGVMGDDLQAIDALVMTAAVADYRPRETKAAKLKRGDEHELVLELVQNPDLLAGIGARRSSASRTARNGNAPMLVGFALETLSDEALIEAARGKLSRKGVDLVVANHADDSFDRDDNRATLVTPDEAEPLPRMSKLALADRILDRVAARCRPAADRSSDP